MALKARVETKEVAKLHTPFGASSSHRWLTCEGSIALCEKAPPSRENEYSKKGTDTHACLEAILKNKDQRFKTEARLLKDYPQDMIERAAKAADEIITRWKKRPGSILLTEQQVDASPFTRKGEFGTLDAAIVEEFGTLEIIDYKDGFGVVEVERNTQLIYYALALAFKYDFNFTRVKHTVIQPNAAHEDGTERSWEISIDELMPWIENFKIGVKRALKPGAPLKSGDHCKYCPAITICPEVSERAFEACKVEFSPVLDSLEVPALRGLDNDTIGSILKHADAIEAWLSEVRALAFTKLDSGQKVPGYKLVPKRASRQWVNYEKTATEAKKVFGAIAFNNDLKTPAQLEKIASDAKPWVEKRCAKVSSGFTLARAGDKREEKADLSLEFNDVSDEKGESMATKKKTAKKKTTKKKSAKKSR